MPVRLLLNKASLPHFVVLARSYVRGHTRKLPSGRTVTIPPYFTKRVPKGEEVTDKDVTNSGLKAGALSLPRERQLASGWCD